MPAHFAVDPAWEDLRAPMWVDFLAPEHLQARALGTPPSCKAFFADSAALSGVTAGGRLRVCKTPHFDAFPPVALKSPESRRQVSKTVAAAPRARSAATRTRSPAGPAGALQATMGVHPGQLAMGALLLSASERVRRTLRPLSRPLLHLRCHVSAHGSNCVWSSLAHALRGSRLPAVRCSADRSALRHPFLAPLTYLNTCLPHTS